MNNPILKEIGLDDLTTYFKFLDALRRFGSVNMWGAALDLRREYYMLTRSEANAVLSSWIATFSDTLSVEDRANESLSSV